MASSSPVSRQRTCKRIALYNYKGGVSKTTTALNLAAALISVGRKVAILDCDGQCNTTGFLVPDLQPEQMDMDETEDEDEGLDAPLAAQGAEPEILRDPVRPAQSPAEEINLDALLQDRLEPNIFSLSYPYFEGRPINEEPELMTVVGEQYGGQLLLLPGSSQIVKLDLELGNLTFDDANAKRIFGFSEHLFTMLERFHKLDFIIVDCGPNSGPLNRQLVLSCDYMLPPVMADKYCLSSVHGLLNHVLPNWFKWQRKLIAAQDAAHIRTDRDFALYAFKRTAPLILPFLVCNYKMSSGPRKVRMLTVHSAKYVRALNRVVTGYLQEFAIPRDINDLRRFVANRLRANRGVNVIAFMKTDVISLLQISQELSRPAFLLTVADIAAQTKPESRDRVSKERALVYFHSRMESLRDWIIWLPL
ncbi:Chromosome-partitioning ATPase Soj [Chlorella vulgaris]